MPIFNAHSSGVLVSNDFINNIMPELNGSFVKVYLAALGLGAAGADASYAEIAERLGLLESDVVKAFSALEAAGALSVEDDTVSIGAPASGAETQGRGPGRREPAISAKKSYSPSELAQEADKNETLADMFALAQEALGKALSPADTNTLYWLYDGLGYTPEVILMLIEYCLSHDKRSMSYIEKVAVAWHERGIKTIEQVERFIASETERADLKRSLMRLFGIHDRSLTKMEEGFIDSWTDECGMSEEMIALAYEYSVIQINKLSFHYMDKIIKRWHENGITTVEQAETDNERFREKSSARRQEADTESIYDHDALEKRAWESLD